MSNSRRLLILTYYYPPDLSAGSFRAEALVKALTALDRDGLTVDVVTTMPNRYGSTGGVDPPKTERIGAVTITRIGQRRPRLPGRAIPALRVESVADHRRAAV